MRYQLYDSVLPQEEFMSAVERVLTHRGFALKDVEHYLNTTDEDIIDPLKLDHIHEGAMMLIKHIRNNSKIGMIVDSDCDGYTSAALFINYLYCLFPAFVQNNIIYQVHTGKQHGIILNMIPDDIQLLIMLDSSSNDYKEHESLFNKGVDVLVIDHHEAECYSPYACVINNQLSKNYENKTLSGVGVVYKFCSYIDTLLGTNYAENFIDLAALGIIGDVMDLRTFETKRIITKGLQQIRNPYFKEMVQRAEFKLGSTITSEGVAFYIAPYVNAVTRVGKQEEKLILFEAMLEHKAYEQIPSTKRGKKGEYETKVEQAGRNCINIKNKQTKLRDESLNKIESIIEENQLLDNKILVVTLEKGMVERNLTGLIANMLMGKYNKPVMILSETENGYEGSARGVNNSSFDDFKDFVTKSGFVEYAAGHANAFGAGIPATALNDFLQYTNEQLADYDFSPFYYVDCIFTPDTVNREFIIDIANHKSLWGQGIPESMVAVENIKVSKDNLKLMSPDKNPTLKITLPDGTSLIKFKSSEEEYNNLYSELGCVTINIVGKCERNEWNGKITPQVIIESYEIVDKAAYYF